MAKKTQESGQPAAKSSKGTRSKAKSKSTRSSAPPAGAATATAEPEELATNAAITDSAGMDDETHAKYEQVKRGELHITDLQKMTASELQDIAKNEDIEEFAGLKKQDLIFQILKKRIQQNGLMYGEGVLEILPDGFGFLRSPEVFEVGQDALCDQVIFVEVEENVRIQRASGQRGWDAAELRRRENLQTPLDVKRERSDHIVENNSNINTLREKVASVYHQIVSPK